MFSIVSKSLCAIRVIITSCSKLFMVGLLQWDSTLTLTLKDCTCSGIGIKSPVIFSPIISYVALTKGIRNEVLTLVWSTCFSTSLAFSMVSSTLINRCFMCSTGFDVLAMSTLTTFFSTYIATKVSFDAD